MPPNVDLNKTVLKVADLTFAGAEDLQKIYVEVRTLTLFCHRKKNNEFS